MASQPYMDDPRPGKSAQCRVIGFYYPDREEPCDRLCRCGFLGNFWEIEGRMSLEAPNAPGTVHNFRNSEAAFQALKFWNDAKAFEELSGDGAFKEKSKPGRSPDLSYGGFRSNWYAMQAVLDQKFRPDTNLTKDLLATGDSFLLEHNSKLDRDKIWSDNSDGTGTNWLGLQLMILRDVRAGKSEDPGSWTHFIWNNVDRATGEQPHSTLWQDAVRLACRELKDALNGQVKSTHIVIAEELPVNESSDRNSTQVVKLPQGTEVEVVEIASAPVDGRVRARIAYPAGWISMRLDDGRNEYVKAARTHIVTAESLPVNTTQSRTSAELAKLPKGTQIFLSEVASSATDGRVRAKIAFPEGWITTRMADDTISFVTKAPNREEGALRYAAGLRIRKAIASKSVDEKNMVLAWAKEAHIDIIDMEGLSPPPASEHPPGPPPVPPGPPPVVNHDHQAVARKTTLRLDANTRDLSITVVSICSSWASGDFLDIVDMLSARRERVQIQYVESETGSITLVSPLRFLHSAGTYVQKASTTLRLDADARDLAITTVSIFNWVPGDFLDIEDAQRERVQIQSIDETGLITLRFPLQYPHAAGTYVCQAFSPPPSFDVEPACSPRTDFKQRGQWFIAGLLICCLVILCAAIVPHHFYIFFSPEIDRDYHQCSPEQLERNCAPGFCPDASSCKCLANFKQMETGECYPPRRPMRMEFYVYRIQGDNVDELHSLASVLERLQAQTRLRDKDPLIHRLKAIVHNTRQDYGGDDYDGQFAPYATMDARNGDLFFEKWGYAVGCRSTRSKKTLHKYHLQKYSFPGSESQGLVQGLVSRRSLGLGQKFQGRHGPQLESGGRCEQPSGKKGCTFKLEKAGSIPLDSIDGKLFSDRHSLTHMDIEIILKQFDTISSFQQKRLAEPKCDSHSECHFFKGCHHKRSGFFSAQLYCCAKDFEKDSLDFEECCSK